MEIPLYPGEILSGRVAAIQRNNIMLAVAGKRLPVETKLLTWDAIRSAAEILSLGERITVIATGGQAEKSGRFGTFMTPSRRQCFVGNLWLSRLPLLPNPWPTLEEKYVEGSVVEVEFVDYVNWYILRAKMPEGFMFELRTNDVHPRSGRNTGLGRRFLPGERIEIVFRSLYLPGGWVERYRNRSLEDACTASGYVTSLIGAERKTAAEQKYLRKRELDNC